jgi:hypothetical protein
MGARRVELEELSEKERLQLAKVLVGFLMSLGATRIEVAGETIKLNQA